MYFPIIENIYIPTPLFIKKNCKRTNNNSDITIYLLHIKYLNIE